MRVNARWRWLARVAIVAVALAVMSSSNPRGAASTPSGPILTRLHPPSELPSALQASLSRQAVTLVSAVAADIDADGDLDIGGSDDHLALIVLVNDGQGHLSRRIAHLPSTLRPEPADPALHGRGDAPNVSVQNEPPTAGPDTARTFDLRDAVTFAPRGRRHAASAALISTRVPRAPPPLRVNRTIRNFEFGIWNSFPIPNSSKFQIPNS